MTDIRTAQTVTRFEVIPTALLLTLKDGKQVEVPRSLWPEMALRYQKGQNLLVINAEEDDSPSYVLSNRIAGQLMKSPFSDAPGPFYFEAMEA